MQGEGAPLVSMGLRLKEERVRLGLSQTAFAELAGASKRAQITWEKDQSSPTGVAFHAWAEAGADIVYIISGARRADLRSDEVADVREVLETIQKEILDPDRIAGIEGQALFLTIRRKKLRSLIDYDSWLMTDETRSRAEQLLELLDDPVKLHDAQAAHLSEARAARDQARRRLATMIGGEDFEPGPDGIRRLAALCTDYSVPVRTLVNLAETLYHDWQDRTERDQ